MITKKDTSIEKNYWNNFYSGKTVVMPSQFCALLASEIKRDTPIIEFGCGNGRDSLFLARHGYSVHAVDLSEEAIAHNKIKAEGLTNVDFSQGDVSDEKDVASVIEEVRSNSKGQAIVVYSRFFLHSLDDAQENKFMNALNNNLNKGDYLYFEYRSKEDQSIDKIYGDHFRRFIDTEEYLESLTNKYAFEVLYSITGQGMAKYKEEDPFVTRIIAKKK